MPTLKARVRSLFSRNPTVHGWFVSLLSPFTIRLFALQRFLSVDELRAKARASMWRRVVRTTDDHLERAVIRQGKATFFYRDGCAFHATAEKASLSGALFAHADYEPNETKLMSTVVSEGWTVIDVGANFGWHAIHLSKLVGARGRVIAFEPILPSFEELAANRQLFAG